MEISSRVLNKNERFCCSKNVVKNIFNNNDIHVSFAFFNRDFNLDPKFYKGIKIKGKIISELIFYNLDQIKRKYNLIISQAGLSFYVLKNEEFSEDLQKEFVSEILPKMYAGYINHKDGNPEKIDGRYFFRVELLNGKFIIHEGIDL